MTFLGQSLHWARLIPRSELWPSAVGGGASVDPQAIKHLAGLPKIDPKLLHSGHKTSGFFGESARFPNNLRRAACGFYAFCLR
jgi:hypothetical protein